MKSVEKSLKTLQKSEYLFSKSGDREITLKSRNLPLKSGALERMKNVCEPLPQKHTVIMNTKRDDI